jgi:hypothetical protein
MGMIAPRDVNIVNIASQHRPNKTQTSYLCSRDRTMRCEVWDMQKFKTGTPVRYSEASRGGFGSLLRQRSGAVRPCRSTQTREHMSRRCEMQVPISDMFVLSGSTLNF